MRDIKFRALVKYGSQDEYRWEYYSTLCEPTWSDKQIAHIKVKDLQYIGFKDKNKKPIYDGDVIAVKHDDDIEPTKHKVEWGGDDYPAWDLEPALDVESNPFSEINCSGCYEIEVIGNIHENPELLTHPAEGRN